MMTSTTTASYHNLTITTTTTTARNITGSSHSDDLNIIRSIHAVIALISMVGSMSVIVYCIYRRTFRNSNVRPVFHLAVADFLLSAAWLTGTVLWSLTNESDITKYPNQKACFYLQSVTEGIHLTTFFLTLNYSVNIYIKIRDRLNALEGLIPIQKTMLVQLLMKMCCISSWLVPFGLIAPVLIYRNETNSSNSDRCLFVVTRPDIPNCSFFVCKQYGSLVFVVTIFLCVFLMIVLYVRVACVYRTLVNYDSSKWTDKERLRVKLMKTRVLMYIVAFLICWIPACGIAMMHLVEQKPVSFHVGCNFIILFILQGVTAPSQGFLNCIVYAWTHRQFRNSTMETVRGLNSIPPQFNQRSYGTMISQIKGLPRQQPLQQSSSH